MRGELRNGVVTVVESLRAELKEQVREDLELSCRSQVLHRVAADIEKKGEREALMQEVKAEVRTQVKEEVIQEMKERPTHWGC